MSDHRCSAVSARPLSVEALESRDLLSGFVQVDLVEGDLVVQGDELANVFAIEQIGDPGGRGSSLTVVPDEDTSINGLAPGAVLDLGPVEVANVRIVPGDGADEVGVHGLSIQGGLKIENSGGSDLYDLVGGEYFKVDIDSTSSQSSATLRDLTIVKNFEKASPKLQQVCCNGKNVSIKMSSVRAEGGVKLDYSVAPGSVELDRVEFDGGLTVTSSSGLSQLTVTKSSLGIRANKATPILMLRASDTNVIASESDVYGSADLKFSQGGGAVQLSSMAIDGRLSVSSSSGRGTASLQDVSIARQANKASPKLWQACTLDNFDVKATSIAVGGAMHVGSSGDKGATGYDKHKNEIDILSARIEGPLRVEHSGEGDLLLGDVEVGRALQITMKHVFISSYQTGGGRPVEEVSLYFNKIAYKYDATKSDKASLEFRDSDIAGSLRVESTRPLDLTIENTAMTGGGYFKLGDIRGDTLSSVRLSSLDVGGSLRVESSGPLDLTTENSRAAVDYFLKIQGAEGEELSSVNLSSLDVGGSLRVESSGPLDLTTENSSAAVDYFLKIQGVEGETLSSVKLSSLDVGGSLRVESSGPLDLTTENSSAAVDYFLKIQGAEGESIESSIDLSQVKIGGDLIVRTGSGEESVQLEGLHVAGRTEIALGRGNDALSIVDSVFGGFALFDGGQGEDALSLSGVEFLGGWRETDWEFISR